MFLPSAHGAELEVQRDDEKCNSLRSNKENNCGFSVIRDFVYWLRLARTFLKVSAELFTSFKLVPR